MFLVDHLSFCINNKFIFKNISFVLFKGDILQICGNNGSGKTVFLKILSGLINDYTGKIFWKYKNIYNTNNVYFQDIVFINDKIALNMLLNVYENIVFNMSLNKCNNIINFDKILNMFVLFDKINNKCIDLSRGQCQKMKFFSLLVKKSKLWILDEPFSYLDKYMVNLLIRIICDFITNNGIVILTDHTNMIHGIKNINLFNYK